MQRERIEGRMNENMFRLTYCNLTHLYLRRSNSFSLLDLNQ